MSHVLLFHYLLLNMFWMLGHPSSGACNLLWIYFMCCIALVRCLLVLRCGSAGVVWCGILMQAEAELTAQHVSNVSTSIFRSLRLIVDLFHVLYCSGSMCVGVTVWFGWGGVVSLCRLKHCFSLPTHMEPEQYNTWNKSIISRKLLKMDVLTFESCWAVNSEIIKQAT